MSAVAFFELGLIGLIEGNATKNGKTFQAVVLADFMLYGTDVLEHHI